MHYYINRRNEIEQRILTEEKLRSSEIHLLASQQIARIGSWELNITNPDNLDSNQLIWSDETYRIFGLEPGDVKINNELFNSMVHPEDRDIVNHIA